MQYVGELSVIILCNCVCMKTVVSAIGDHIVTGATFLCAGVSEVV